MQRKPTLGRGLADLLGARQAAAVAAVTSAPAAPAVPRGEELTRLPLDVLQRGRYQPRADMRAESLAELAASIKVQGVVQPIVVRPVESASNGQTQRYEIIAGERRRWPASVRSPRSSATFPTRPPSPWPSSRTSSART